MKQRRLGLGAAVRRGLLLFAGAIAVVAVASIPARTGAGPTAASAAGSHPVAQAQQLPTKGPAPSPDPDEGLTPDQVYAKQQAGAAVFELKRLAWLNSPQVAAIDWRTLPSQPMNVDVLPGSPTFEDALDHADVAVLGHVVSVRPDQHGTATTFAIERTSKGSGIPKILTVTQSGGIEPTADFQSAYLMYFDGAPLLLPGDRAVLLLQHDLGSGRYRIQSYSGEYASAGGKVKTVKDSRFHDVDGSTEAELMDRADRHFKGAS